MPFAHDKKTKIKGLQFEQSSSPVASVYIPTDLKVLTTPLL